ncbi:MAG: TIGR03905 family TSCPD domain-containing protein [Bacteroidaceae bacterium]|nr:TIGR03905 family TSCPD domain-containing protein [Bacteroidaceae bacterium]
MEQAVSKENNVKHTVYKTQGTCSQYIEIEAQGDVVTKCVIYGGCAGNTKGLSHLVEGMKVDAIMSKLNGITCGAKPTSCPDQLCRALEQLQSEE